ncbi:MAG: glucose dehydrogenase, partial [Gemmatimonadetes bacterium]
MKYLFPLMCVLAACGDSTSIPPPPPPPPPPGTPMLQAVGTFFRPTYLTAPVSDSTRLFVTERGGAIRIVRNDTIVPTPFLDLRGKIDSAVESGLFSMAFHPQYATNHKFFAFFTNLNGDTRIVRYLGTANPDSA